MAKLIQAYDTRTGEVRNVPENWFDHEQMSQHLKKGKPPAPAKADTDAAAPKATKAQKGPQNSESGEPTTTPQGGDK